MRILFLCIATTVLFTSCFGPRKNAQEKARSYIRKALKLDSNIVRHWMAEQDVEIHFAQDIILPSEEGFFSLNCDSINKLARANYLEQLREDSLSKVGDKLPSWKGSGTLPVKKGGTAAPPSKPAPKPITLYEKNGTKISAVYNPVTGMLEGIFDRLADTISIDSVLKIHLSVPCESLNVPVDAPYYTYYWFWILVAVCLFQALIIYKLLTKAKT